MLKKSTNFSYRITNQISTLKCLNYTLTHTKVLSFWSPTFNKKEKRRRSLTRLRNLIKKRFRKSMKSWVFSKPFWDLKQKRNGLSWMEKYRNSLLNSQEIASKTSWFQTMDYFQNKNIAKEPYRKLKFWSNAYAQANFLHQLFTTTPSAIYQTN